jgi:rhodanese-related sulfurtransferase
MAEANATTGAVSPKEAAALLESGEAQVVDVRTPAEREAGHVPGSRHVELDRLPEAIHTLDPDRPVVLYCRGGSRQAMAAEALAAAGWDARVLEGGIVGWQEEGLPLEPEGGRVVQQPGLPPA